MWSIIAHVFKAWSAKPLQRQQQINRFLKSKESVLDFRKELLICALLNKMKHRMNSYLLQIKVRLFNKQDLHSINAETS